MKIEMRRKDRQLTEEETIQLLEATEYGILSTVSEDGTPYGVPISFAFKDHCIYMHGAKAEGHKLRNVASNAEGCFTVVDHVQALPEKFSTQYMSAIAFGKLQVVTEEKEKHGALEALIQKYSPDFYESGLAYIERAAANTTVIKLEVSHMTGKGRK
ncbi:MAG: pyridoxamine 5'-phosphate oxidase family protein [bacterium]|nr:pyridoxamine 5'-phosphate oxidase family protein [bacterium]